MTYIEDSRPLLQWFLNLKQNIQNKEPLLLLFYLIRGHEQTQIAWYMKELHKFIRNLNPHVVYKILNLSDVGHIDDINPNENILLVSNNIFSISKIRDCNKIVLYYRLNQNDLKEITNLNNLHFEYLINYEIDKFSRDKYYIEQRDPLEYIQQQYTTINSIITFYGMKLLGSKQNLNIQMWEKKIDEEIHILLSHNILTSQLAIAIYKACTLQFKDSNTKIGRYYYSHLEVRSKTMQLPNINNAKYKKPRRLAKAYDLNESPNIDNLFYISHKKIIN